jgi:hypothetical protein
MATLCSDGAVIIDCHSNEITVGKNAKIKKVKIQEK